MYNLSPKNITSTLSAKISQNSPSTNEGIAILLIEDVPIELRGKMQQIN